MIDVVTHDFCVVDWATTFESLSFHPKDFKCHPGTNIPKGVNITL